ncbi:protein kinase domain protein [Ichthyophthirius multifiliis]|uniref:Protein kinase domain protein n=1 Tax=Ichthyophthirius multifiliis TaxID=5932 RepID=G0R1X3_ICHMU|nr:protein kinase domain protein [Ichthyophthirius multifiliis]EGR28534.1 protein kinase domain protein [Ichthyophthirius multifiliis]|eukprot:XP_004029770.1 protein kinase domain protein [Ichthyophthirius multifiliis]
MKNFKREVDILNSLNNPYIIKLYKVLDGKTTLNLVMEYIGSNSLYAFLKSKSSRKINEEEAKHIFYQIMEGIKYLHHMNTVHRDIKLENLLIDDFKNIKIIDFGFAIKVFTGKKLGSFCGTPSYMAPEIAGKKEYFGQPVDIWSCGVLLYVLICGQFPFKGSCEQELYKKIIDGRFEFPQYVSNQARNLISQMLNVFPEERPDANQVLRNSWFININQQINSNNQQI